MRSLLPLLLVLTLACEPHNKLAVDNDGDGVTEFEGDCDDGDADKGPGTEDEDCDGVVTSEDCDDGDANQGAGTEDGDCDGVLTAEDCDDSDASMPMEDIDCDGVLTAEDCDDADTSVGICWVTVSAGWFHTCGVCSQSQRKLRTYSPGSRSEGTSRRSSIRKSLKITAWSMAPSA